MFSVLLHLKHPVHIALPLAFLFDQLSPKRVIIQPVFRQRQGQFFIIGHKIDGGQQIVTPPAGKEDRQSQQATKMFGNSRRDGILLMKR